jgi:hypothetical protein
MKNLVQTSLALALSIGALTAHAGAVHDSGLFTGNSLARNDDDSTDLVSLGFNANINGTTYSSAYVNNNGNITFQSPLSDYTPDTILSNPFPIVAAFWADVDTRSGPGLTQYGSATLNGKKVFGINWIDVGYYQSHADKLNSFQMILTDRSDVAAGDFDIQFNYDKVQWETGDASDGASGSGGKSAAVGYVVDQTNAFQLTGSFVNGALIDGGSNALISHSLSSATLGQYNFQVRAGEVTPAVPEPETYALMLAGLGVVAFMARHRARRG